jgi:hypothetical protein
MINGHLREILLLGCYLKEFRKHYFKNDFFSSLPLQNDLSQIYHAYFFRSVYKSENGPASVAVALMH